MRRFPSLLPLAAILLAAATALAQTPKAVITGPREARCGALVVLDGTESQGLGRLWLLAVAPEETSFLPVESGLKCLFASPTPGRYEFLLVVSGTNANGGPAAEIARHTVTLAGAPTPPEPPDPPQPPVTTGRRLLVILRESSQTDTQTATTILQMRTDDQFLARIRAKNHPPPIVLDPDSADPLVARLTDAARRDLKAKDLQPPLAAVLDYSAGGDKGPILTIAPMPADLAGLLAMLSAAGG